MYAHPQQRADHDVQKLRRDAGKWLRQLREARNLSQRDLARLVGVEYYTFIAQLEAGRGRIPPDRYEKWAGALNLKPQLFVKELMRFYDPVTYAILFGDESAPAGTGTGTGTDSDSDSGAVAADTAGTGAISLDAHRPPGR